MRSGASAEPLRRVERHTVLAPGREPGSGGPSAPRGRGVGAGLRPDPDRVRAGSDPRGGDEPPPGSGGGRAASDDGHRGRSLGPLRPRGRSRGAGASTVPCGADPNPGCDPPRHGRARAGPGAGPGSPRARRARSTFRGADGVPGPSGRRDLVLPHFLFTLTVTATEVVTFPSASRARAASWTQCSRAGTVPVSQATSNGAV